jgi:LPXTG-motif cell wall-anchored protein
VTNQVTNNVNTQVQANAEAEAKAEAEAQAESESEGGPELAQAETEDEESAGGGGGQSTVGGQPAALASTGVNVGALALIGALCIGASLLLFRRRGTA